jgi:hypothetical protein
MQGLDRVDWGALTHAYGYATDAPDMLRDLVHADPAVRARGWDGWWGALNHQGDFYDATVAAIPFLVAAAADPGTPDRTTILAALADRLDDAPDYGGDPGLPEPPGGTDVLTPSLPPGGAPTTGRVFEVSAYRRMDLCAWQTARAILAGTPTLLTLLDDADVGVSGAAASLLLRHRSTRPQAKAALHRRLADGADASAAALLLRLGRYADPSDLPALRPLLADPERPHTQLAAALVWFVAATRAPEDVRRIVQDALDAGAHAFASLPREGLYARGPWSLRGPLAWVALELARVAADPELRWRSVQGLGVGHAAVGDLDEASVVAALVETLTTSPYNRIRVAAAYALLTRGETVFDHPAAPRALEAALAPFPGTPFPGRAFGFDEDLTVIAHVGRILSRGAHRLDDATRQRLAEALQAARDRAPDTYITIGNAGTKAAHMLGHQAERLAAPRPLLHRCLETVAFPFSEGELSIEDARGHLADALDADVAGTLALAVGAVRGALSRNAGLGAADWLATLGPVAAKTLHVLDARVASEPGAYERERLERAAAALRDALAVPVAADVIDPTSLSDDALQTCLDDPSEVVVGIRGRRTLRAPYRAVVHWVVARRDPRLLATRELVARRAFSAGLFHAMVACASIPLAAIGSLVTPCRFPIDAWRAAAEAVGAPEVVDGALRAAAQQATDGSTATELRTVARSLSGLHW